MGQRRGLSAADVVKLRRLYSCQGKGEEEVSTEEEVCGVVSSSSRPHRLPGHTVVAGLIVGMYRGHVIVNT